MATDYYALLKIKRDATQDEVKRAYRRLAREMHPDVNPDPETQEKFKEVTQAYEVLSDVDKRRMYDMGLGPDQSGGSPQNDDGSKDFGVSEDFTRATAGKSPAEKLYTALCLNHDEATANALLAQNIVPDEKTLQYFVDLMWPAWVKKLIDVGAEPTSRMLYESLCVNRAGETASVLLDAGVQPDRETLSYVRKHEWYDWERKLTAAIICDQQDVLPPRRRPMI